jgi:hypothetical protein
LKLPETLLKAARCKLHAASGSSFFRAFLLNEKYGCLIPIKPHQGMINFPPAFSRSNFTGIGKKMSDKISKLIAVTDLKNLSVAELVINDGADPPVIAIFSMDKQ